MLRYGKSALGLVAQPRMAIALIAATVAFGGTVSEASAKSKHRHHHKHHHHHAAKKAVETNPFEANASMGPASIGPFMPDIAAPMAPARTGGRSFSGVASFYGNEAGNKTASGARFNQNAMTAAHRSLPFGTKLRVTHGSRSVVVTVNDRGPFIKGRVLDLSKGAASAIGLTSRGVGKVVAEVM